MKSDAQRRAENNYRKKTKQIILRFYPNSESDLAIYSWLKKQENTTDYLKSLVAEDMAERRETMNEKYPRSYRFVSADGQTVEVRISGDYDISSDHDWDVLTDTDQTYIEEDDGSEVFEWIEEHVEFEENQRRFVENMIVTVMAYRDWTFDQLLDSQAEHEAKNQIANK